MKPTTEPHHPTRRAALAAMSFPFVAAGAWAHGDGAAHAETPKFDARQVQATPFGQAGDPSKATRTIQLDMADTMRFSPAGITVRRGETVRLAIANKGRLLHELVLGTASELKQHAEMMRKHPGMSHAAPHMAHVQPGASGEIVWQFTQAGEFQFACLLPGHFEAGMWGRVTVE